MILETISMCSESLVNCKQRNLLRNGRSVFLNVQLNARPYFWLNKIKESKHPTRFRPNTWITIFKLSMFILFNK